MFKVLLPATCLFAIMTANAESQPQFPHATIANDRITAVILLPDTQNGYYRGTRFDWSGGHFQPEDGKSRVFREVVPDVRPEIARLDRGASR